MDGKLFLQAIGKLAAGILVMAALLFLPAGTTRYWNGWLLMGILFIPMLFAGIILLLKCPDLLRKRLNADEREPEQKKAVAWSGIVFLAAFLVAGFNYRFGWVVMPAWSAWLAAGVFLLAYLLYAQVMRENAYLSRTVEVQEGQRVVDTGLYGIVRHPMYSATLLLFLSMPLVLGSPLSFAIMLFYIPIIRGRILNEERVLADGLEGYAEYLKRVKYRLIPHIW